MISFLQFFQEHAKKKKKKGLKMVLNVQGEPVIVGEDGLVTLPGKPVKEGEQPLDSPGQAT